MFKNHHTSVCDAISKNHVTTRINHIVLSQFHLLRTPDDKFEGKLGEVLAKFSTNTQHWKKMTTLNVLAEAAKIVEYDEGE